jgi:hypothetical protein
MNLKNVFLFNILLFSFSLKIIAMNFFDPTQKFLKITFSEIKECECCKKLNEELKAANEKNKSNKAKISKLITENYEMHALGCNLTTLNLMKNIADLYGFVEKNISNEKTNPNQDEERLSFFLEMEKKMKEYGFNNLNKLK